MLLIKLAWRNLFRNKRRTFIAGTAIGLGLAALIFIDALMIGMVDNYIHNATASFMGEAQILREGFRETSEVELTITDFVGTIARLEEEPIVERFAPRTSTFGTITSAANMSAVNIFGIDPDRERHLSIVDEAVFEGDYFDGENARDILIGEKLADVLEAGLGDRLVLTVAQVGSGDIAQELFRISGIFDMGDRTMNGNVAFVRIDKAREHLT
jgi:ABC-type lipoprotein release transport system permease subunit